LLDQEGIITLRHQDLHEIVGSEALTAVVMNVAMFWDIAPYSPYVNRRFGGMYHLHLQF
jgi:hypothetical protein